MSEPFVAEVRIWANNFAPRGWAFCNGQLMPIAQNTALFSLLGTTYGGDGKTSFGLPDLAGRAPMQAGQGPGLTARSLGESGGSDVVTLLETEMPAHVHALTGRNEPGDQSTPQAGDNLALDNRRGSPEENISYLNNTPTARVAMSPQQLAPSGGSQAHENRQPFLALNFCIALEGVFPQRP